MSNPFGASENTDDASNSPPTRRSQETPPASPNTETRRPSSGLVPIANLLNPSHTDSRDRVTSSSHRSGHSSDVGPRAPVTQNTPAVSSGTAADVPLPVRPHDGPSVVQETNAGQTRGEGSVRFGGIQDLVNPNNMAGIDNDTVRLSLRVVQQPVAARACGQADSDRRVIDPPPIVQLLVEAPTLPENVVHDYLRYNYQMLVELFDETGTVDASSTVTRNRRGSNLIGETAINSVTVTSPPARLECFFGFFDLSVRLRGRYRLRFSLLMVDYGKVEHQHFLPYTSRVMSEPFMAQSPAEFAGMSASTELTAKLVGAGARGTVRSRRERRPAPHEDDAGGNEADGNDNDNDN